MGSYAQEHDGLYDKDTFSFQTTHENDSLKMDSLFRITAHKGFGLLDTISNDTLLRTVLMPYRQIRGAYVSQSLQRLDLPAVKEIRTRTSNHGAWKFWVICLILVYVSFVRIANPNNFRVFLLSVFNLKLSEKIWDDQRSIFSFVILQLFAIYLFIAALFINYFLELKNINPMHSFFTQYLIIFGVLVVVYLCKFIIHGLLGVLLKMNKLGVGFVANTVSVNNFLSLIVFPFIIFMIYNEDHLWSLILTQTVIAIFFISVLYRMGRIALLSHTFFSFPKIYLFIYLCALEIVPWFVIIKFINHYQV
jgi:hypothetical protein